MTILIEKKDKFKNGQIQMESHMKFTKQNQIIHKNYKIKFLMIKMIKIFSVNNFIFKAKYNFNCEF